MPSASTHVCSSHHTRSFHSRRRVAFQDDELLERQFRAAGADRWLRSPSTRAAIATFGARLPVLAQRAARRTVGGRCVAWHLPPTQNRCIPTNSRTPSLAESHVEGAPLVWLDQAKHVNARNGRAGLRTWAEIRLATFTVLGRSAVDAAFRASEPIPRNSHRLPLSRAGAASRCRAWIVPGARPRNRTPLMPTALANDRCGERIGRRPNRTERPRQRDAPRTGPRHLKPPAEPTQRP